MSQVDIKGFIWAETQNFVLLFAYISCTFDPENHRVICAMQVMQSCLAFK